MGTLNDWLQVFLNGGFWGAVMFWINRPIDADKRRKLRSWTIQLWSVGGFLFGFLIAFGSRAFRWPLIAVLIPLIVFFIAVGVSFRRKLRDLISNNSGLPG